MEHRISAFHRVLSTSICFATRTERPVSTTEALQAPVVAQKGPAVSLSPQRRGRELEQVEAPQVTARTVAVPERTPPTPQVPF